MNNKFKNSVNENEIPAENEVKETVVENKVVENSKFDSKIMSQHRYMPQTGEDIEKMLDRCGAASVDDLFADIPAELRMKALPGTCLGTGRVT